VRSKMEKYRRYSSCEFLMSGLNKEEADEFLKESLRELVKQRALLRKLGWKKKNKDKDCVLWVSPKGEEYRHDMGFFGGHTQAIYKAKHDIVLESFIQFQIQVFNDEDRPKNKRGTEKPIDWFFPCIKENKLYWYDEAVYEAVYNQSIHYQNDRWLKVKSLIESEFTLSLIRHGDIIEIVEFYNDYTGDWEFKLR
jgi:hypothetical protein